MDEPGREQTNATLGLVAGAQRGDKRALEKLFSRYLPRVRQIVALRMGRRLRQFVELEDVVQGALLRTFKSLKNFEEQSEAAFRNYVARCVEREIVDWVRKERGRRGDRERMRRFGDFPDSQLLSTSVLAAKDPTPSQVLRGKELEEKIEKALLDLPQHHREAIILRYICEMSYEQVADAMGLTNEAAARKACSRAGQKLKEILRS